MARRRPAVLNKLQPKLRMVANGSTPVNVARSEHCAALIVPPQLANSVQIERGDDAEPQTAAKPPRRGRLKEPPEAFVSVFLQFAPGEFDRIDLPPDLDAVTAVKGDSATAVLKVERALALADNNRVAAIELGQPLRLPDPIAESTGRARTKAPSMDDRRFGDARRHRNGEGVLIGIIDVQGLRLRPSGLPRRRRPDPVRPHLGPGRRTPPTPAANRRLSVRLRGRAPARST